MSLCSSPSVFGFSYSRERRREAYLERQPGRDVFPRASRVIECVVGAERKLAPDGQVPFVWEVIGAPEGKAARITVVAALVLRRTVQESVIVHLLAWVVLMDISPSPLDLIRRVLDYFPVSIVP